MSKLVKSIGIAAVTCGCMFSVIGQDAGTNLLKTWNLYGAKGSTVIENDGNIACECKGEKDSSGVKQSVELNQTEAKTIEFSAESKAEDVSGNADSNYSIYLDIEHTDGSKTYGVIAVFNTGTHEWEKASLSYTPSRPVKSLNYYLLFRNKTGKVWFKNVVLIQK
ncbi:MAG: hypothetical protein WCI51_03880 [Lentisphaerota bacterium]